MLQKYSTNLTLISSAVFERGRAYRRDGVCVVLPLGDRGRGVGIQQLPVDVVLEDVASRARVVW